MNEIFELAFHNITLIQSDHQLFFELGVCMPILQHICIKGYVAIFMLIFLSASTTVLSGTYRQPPQEIIDLVDAPPSPGISVSPDESHMLILYPPSFPSIAEVSQPELRLAGLRINPRVFGPSRTTYYSRVILKNLRTGQETPISGIPGSAKIRYLQWSADGRHFAFVLAQEQELELWLCSLETSQARCLLSGRLHAVTGSPYTWLPDNKTLLVKLRPDDPGDVPAPPSVPDGPVVQENIGKKAPAPTFQDLLKNEYDQNLFDYYSTSQVCTLDLNGTISQLLPAALYRSINPSPDGRYLLVQTMHRPYSYLVPFYRFPVKVEIFDNVGRLVKQIADLPLAEEVPIGNDAVPTGPRYYDWRQDVPATLYWVEAQDGGNPKKPAEIRDKLYWLSEPFTDNPHPFAELSLRYAGVYWGDQKTALIYESWWLDRKTKVWQFDPSHPDGKPEKLLDYSSEDRYHHPGAPLLQLTSFGTNVLQLGRNGRSIYMRGEGASPKGNMPFLDELDVNSGKTVRLWQCQAPYYEYVVELTRDTKSLITRREGITEQPNYYIRLLKEKSVKPLTNFPHPSPQLLKVKKELITYKRQDGVQLSATLYLPPNYTPDQGALPLLMWAYPQEFKSADAAGQVTDSPYRFVRVSYGSPLFWLVRGYAILDDPTMPIVGEGSKEPNDTYVEQLVASAQAAVDEVVRRGVADPKRIAIGGHSYGAFMTANLLSHCDLFAAGIARSGAYNRTLTPFGFQAEERLLWEAPNTYITMSPFMHAEKVKAPLLLIHGEADNNTGTFPIQSERYYNALKGLGKTARLVILPAESHGYQARESILHMLWEMDQWLETYVKMKK
jgi:dipeptidyl aminopeptidase/acylaminoacyl peptidase